MNEYINLDEKNIEEEHICCAIGDPKHQDGVDKKKEWIKSKLKDGHVFRKLDITLLQFMGKLFNFLSKKAYFKRKKIHGSFKWTSCGSGKKYKQCHGK